MNLNHFSEEIKALFKQWPVWFMLGTQDIKLKYRRSSIGPLWITLSMAVTVYSLGFLYGHLFKVELHHYFPFLAAGIIGWTFISTLILEASGAFIEAEVYIKNQESFMSLFMMRLVLRNFIVFFHNLLVFLPIFFIFHITIGFKTLFFIPGVLIVCVNAMLWGILFAVIGTRYRDFEQIISKLVQVVFFLTPVMWMPKLLPERLQWVISYNPFNQFLNLIRAPLLNSPIELRTLGIVGFVTLLGFVLCVYFLGKYKNRIVFWL